MFRHYQTDINYAKLIEIQANQPAFGIDKVASKSHKSAKTNNKKGKTKTISRSTFKVMGK